ncbi:SAM-dependent methyltransferase [Actinoplanes subtropicus]|uniref:SAM-dependent methyltransferase n=1 Tax=Actinoplanes subtropicus TaxID=543632 RepID=UPI0004C2FA54|nr:SAM-dependent methyltransferase [Actinoplanes subtropicus]
MTESSAWVPEGVDITVPNASRVYDFALGGVHNFRVDRDFFTHAEQAMPQLRLLAQANRSFLGRAVRWLTEAGMRQFLDLGSGIPTLGNVHEVAQETHPGTRVVYVDIDPVAVEQSNSLLSANRYATAIRGDLRDPQAILRDPRLLEFLDFSEPVAVLMVAVLHFIPDRDDPRSIIREFGGALMPGSYLALSHGTLESTPEGRAQQETVRKLYEQTPTPFVVRDPEQVAALIEDCFDLLPPGVVSVDQWRPDPEDDELPQPVLAAVGRRR